MAKEYEFRPDPVSSGDLDKLLLTQRQRFGLLRWALYGAVSVLSLILQDVALYRVDIAGGGMDLVPCVIIMITALEGAEGGCIYALIAALMYEFSGSAPGIYIIPIITAIAVLTAIFRQACLRQGFFAILLCAAMGMIAYEMCVFGIGLFLGYTLESRLIPAALSAAVTMIGVPFVYPILRAIGKIGGETWKE